MKPTPEIESAAKELNESLLGTVGAYDKANEETIAHFLAKLIAQERVRVLTEIQCFAKETADEYAKYSIVAWNACDDIRLECKLRAAAERREDSDE